MRLDRLVSQHSGSSRREVTGWIRAKRLTVNGVVVRDAGYAVATGVDIVLLDGALVRAPFELTLMLHKPAGCVSATEDTQHQTVLDLLPAALRRPGLAPIGRLDKDTTGLLLLTTDGSLQHLIAHPRRKVEKVYRATLLPDTLEPDAEARFAAGIVLADGSVCRPALLQRLPADRVLVTVVEGKYHQVKRMLGACGGHVTALHRQQVGPLRLDSDLAEGEARPLSPAEVEALRAAASDPVRAGERP